MTARTPSSEPVSYCSNLHEPFLQRAEDSSDKSPNGHALGAFLTLRMVDQFGAQRETSHADAITYQIRATKRFLNDLRPVNVEAKHLQEIVRVADAILKSGKVRVLWPPLLAYAYWLEQHLRLAEALDALETTLELSDGHATDEEIATHLQLGRVLRLSGRFDDSRESYARAGYLAASVGDTHSELLSRIGAAFVLLRVGNLLESQRMLRAVLQEAQQLADRDAEARASHDLAVALHHLGRSGEAVPLAYRAFELYDQPTQRIRALNDTGQFLKQLGHYCAAKDALTTVLKWNPPPELRHRAAVELLEVSALIQDRITFERLRRELDASYDRLPIDERVEYEMLLGTGLAAFDLPGEGEAHLGRAVALAEQHGLGAQLFRAEAALREVRECRAHPEGSTAPAREPIPGPEMQTTIQRLEALRAGD